MPNEPHTTDNGPRTIESRYPGKCSICGEQHIEPGDTIVAHDGKFGTWATIACYETMTGTTEDATGDNTRTMVKAKSKQQETPAIPKKIELRQTTITEDRNEMMDIYNRVTWGARDEMVAHYFQDAMFRRHNMIIGDGEGETRWPVALAKGEQEKVVHQHIASRIRMEVCNKP